MAAINRRAWVISQTTAGLLENSLVSQLKSLLSLPDPIHLPMMKITRIH
jgi:hypothetical protein